MRKSIIGSSIICVLIIFLVLNPARYISSTYNGLLLFITTVAPAVLPFFFFTKLLTCFGFSRYIGNKMNPIIQKIYHVPGIAGYVFVMAILSGYPVGSKLVSDLYSDNIITEKEAQSISTFTSTSGPLFVIGTVGSYMFNNAIYGYIIFLAHLIATLINGLIFRPSKKKAYTNIKQISIQQETPLLISMTDSITSVLIVGGFIAILSMLIDVLIDINFVSSLSFLLSKILLLFKLPSNISEGIIISLIEMTRGINILSKIDCETKIILPIIAGLISFGGLSVCLQATTFLSKANVKVSFYLVSKLSQAIITTIITYILVLILL